MVLSAPKTTSTHSPTTSRGLALPWEDQLGHPRARRLAATAGKKRRGPWGVRSKIRSFSQNSGCPAWDWLRSYGEAESSEWDPRIAQWKACSTEARWSLRHEERWRQRAQGMGRQQASATRLTNLLFS